MGVANGAPFCRKWLKTRVLFSHLNLGASCAWQRAPPLFWMAICSEPRRGLCSVATAGLKTGVLLERSELRSFLCLTY
ncbi:hypothetical protein ACS0TY_020160 [Phlomoides rotata]